MHASLILLVYVGISAHVLMGDGSQLWKHLGLVGSELSVDRAEISRCQGNQEERHGKGNGMTKCQEHLPHHLVMMSLVISLAIKNLGYSFGPLTGTWGAFLSSSTV